jgi:hypothetical protein
VPKTPEPAKDVPACEPFTARSAPTAVIPFRRAVELHRLGVSIGDPIEGQEPLELSCVRVAFPDGVIASLALDLQLAQQWSFQSTYIADLQTTLALAPREEVRLELRTTQRKLLQQSVVDSVEELQSSEATVVDKETMNVARASAATKSWHVDGSGSFSLGPVSLGASAGTSSSVTQSATSAVDQVHETTKRSAESLKTLHKIEVNGLSETIVDERVVRRVRNPYDDRTLTLNVFQLLKRYDVTTSLAATRPALVLAIERLVMDRHFVLANGGFLRESLLDADLLTELVGALANARRTPRRERETEARNVAIASLHYLFEVPNIFNAPNVFGVSNNDPAVSFNASTNAGSANAGLVDSVANHAGVVFTTLNFFYRRFADLSSAERNAQAVSFATALANGTRAQWEALSAEPDTIRKVLDLTGFTEGLRRLSGFLAMVDGMLRPLLEPLEHEREAQAAAEAAELVIDRVVVHLECLREYYIQRFLQYLVKQTGGLTLPRFVRTTIDRLQISPAARQLFLSVFDPRLAFLDRNEIVVPASSEISYVELVQAAGGKIEPEQIELPTVTDEVDVPFDGIHLEIAPGHCRLPDVPSRSEIEIGEMAIRNLRGEGSVQ